MSENWITKDGSVIVSRGKAVRLALRYAESKVTPVRLLDVGSGRGLFIESLPKERFEIWSSDLKNFLSPEAKQKVKEFAIADLNEKLSYQKNFFDMITAWQVVEHLENPFCFIREAGRVIKSDGYLIISMPNVFNLRNRFGFLFRAEMHRYNENNNHIFIFTKTTLNKLIQTGGFELVAKGFIGRDLSNFIDRLSLVRWRLPVNEWFGHSLYLVLKKKAIE